MLYLEYEVSIHDVWWGEARCVESIVETTTSQSPHVTRRTNLVYRYSINFNQVHFSRFLRWSLSIPAPASQQSLHLVNCTFNRTSNCFVLRGVRLSIEISSLDAFNYLSNIDEIVLTINMNNKFESCLNIKN